MIEQPIPSVRLAAHQFSSSIVKIQYDDARLDTTLQLQGGQCALHRAFRLRFARPRGAAPHRN